MTRLLRYLRSRKAPPAAPAIPDGRRVYAIGDIHGRLDCLDGLMATIATDRCSGPADVEFVFLGDLVDRGPQSREVIDRVRAIATVDPTTILTGNHEEVMLLSLDGDLEAIGLFDRIGGRETMLSYGIDPATYAESSRAELRALLARHVPADHVAFLRGLSDRYSVGDYRFVHAGMRPGIALADQKLADLRWIRESFLCATRGFDGHVVHGHTITEQAELLPHRSGIDTGAFRTGRLTALVLEGTDRRLIEAICPPG